MNKINFFLFFGLSSMLEVESVDISKFEENIAVNEIKNKHKSKILNELMDIILIANNITNQFPSE